MNRQSELVQDWLGRCDFPANHQGDSPVTVTANCAFSGGPDSTALVILAQAAGLDVVAHHVDHGHAPHTDPTAELARGIADQLGVEFRLHHAHLTDGPNFEARARAARRELLPDGSMTGHTTDDLAETVMYRLMRGTGPDGLSAMQPGPQHPILNLRRSDTVAICDLFEVEPVIDPTNSDRRFVRNRIRTELLPLMSEIARRDVVPLIARTAGFAADQRALLDSLSDEIDPTDARSVAELPSPLAERVLRRWIEGAAQHGYPPDAAALERVLAVARGDAIACEIGGGLRVERHHQRLVIVGPVNGDTIDRCDEHDEHDQYDEHDKHDEHEQ